jgi:hypothetical protein
MYFHQIYSYFWFLIFYLMGLMLREDWVNRVLHLMLLTRNSNIVLGKWDWNRNNPFVYLFLSK